CIDFNSLEESHKLTTLLMKWTVQYDVSIITALHINKGNDELRGHLGSFLGQKGDSIMRITKENDGMLYISCKITDSRHKPIDDFNFRIVEGIPEPYEVDLSKKAQVNYQDIFENVLSTPLKYCDLATEVAKTTNKAISTANRYIKTATELGIIKNNDGYYVCDSTLPF
ncbi:MAG: hypothetical protein PHS04_15615, partial [Tissierellia bacterium]|nr:hypothetical protein [Tissierellia bacterium]